MSLERLVFVRHDTSSLNNSGYVQGQTNTSLQPGFRGRIDELTDVIVQQEGISYLQELPIYVFSSHLERTTNTAERIHRRLLDRHSLVSELRYSSNLIERGQGDIEGLSFQEALPHLSSDPNLPADAGTIYGLLYTVNNVPNGERHEAVTARLEQFVKNYVQQLEGIGIISAHLISGMNYLKNLLTDGYILGSPPRPYQPYPNLSVVTLVADSQSFMRYKETKQYGPPNHNGVLVGSRA